MSQSVPITCANLAIALLIHYSFDLSGYSASELIHRWRKQYPPDWLHLAVIEALYQGRYKGISVQQILAFWLRRGQVIYHFNMEFERLICSQFPASLTATTTTALNFHQQPTVSERVTHDPDPVLVASPPVENGHGSQQTSSIQLMNVKQLETVSQEATQPTPKVLAASRVGVMTAAVQPRLKPAEIPSQEINDPPITLNHPPIGQFTPAKSDRSESFTSKLKAMSEDQIYSM
ncbi:hypothetical protein [Nostoc sp. UHCC 0870]|uniref:hypothetical protein n=1 Tax=Nostoc sp. UHCC 0870 TaxID=2914041 RepID=UPI001EE0A1FA|nr:hypothetical protein [Nostoc sp. UHCC 0870]UKP00124.1 hypothetical protein L6494_10675 [Nostoc sp. UHCC 0870]